MELESRILARLTDDEIAAEMSMLSAGSVRLYESVFFNVRSRLDLESLIVLRALGGMDLRSEARPLYDVVKRLAYSGGRLVLDFAMWAAVATRDELDRPDQTGEILREMRIRLMLDQMPVNKTTAPLFMQLAQAQAISRGVPFENAAADFLESTFAAVDVPDTALWQTLKSVYSKSPPASPINWDTTHASAI